MDVFTKEKRSEVMSLIKGRDTKPEFFIRSALHRLGYRYRLHVLHLPGKPDLVFPKYNALIFVNGCFWHGHNCHLFKWPKTRKSFWRTKILKNQENDKKNIKALKRLGWRVLTVWECSLKGKSKLSPEKLVQQVEDWLNSQKKHLELKGRNAKRHI